MDGVTEERVDIFILLFFIHAHVDVACCLFFFFHAEDGIRYFHVTGVQTCALPISPPWWSTRSGSGGAGQTSPGQTSPRRPGPMRGPSWEARSEERRVGKECRS